MLDLIKSRRFRLSFIVTFLILFVCSFYYFEVHKTKLLAMGLFFSVVVIGALLISFKLDEKGRGPFEVFVFVFLGFGLFSTVFFPAGSIPDETFHFDKSYSYWMTLSTGSFSQIRTEDLPLIEPGGLLNNEISEKSWGYSRDHLLTPAVAGFTDLSEVKDYDTNLISEVDLISELPQLKLPSAIGIGLGISFGLNHVLVFLSWSYFQFYFFGSLDNCGDISIARV